MGTQAEEKDGRKEALKELRESRKESVEASRAQMTKHKKNIREIKRAMERAEKTVPEIAQEASMPASDVMWYIAALKKYGEVAEAEKAGAYFKYRLVEK